MNIFTKDILNEVYDYYTNLLNEDFKGPIKTFKIPQEDIPNFELVLASDPTCGGKPGTDEKFPGRYSKWLGNLYKNGGREQLIAAAQNGELTNLIKRYHENGNEIENFKLDDGSKTGAPTPYNDFKQIVDQNIPELHDKIVKEPEKELSEYEKWLNEPDEEGDDTVAEPIQQTTEDIIKNVEMSNPNADTLYAIGKGEEFETLHRRPDGTVPERRVGESIDGELLIYMDDDWAAIAEETFKAGQALSGSTTISKRPKTDWCVSNYEDVWNDYYHRSDVNGQMIHLFSLHPGDRRGHWLLSRYGYGQGPNQRSQFFPSKGYRQMSDAYSPMLAIQQTGAKGMEGVLNAMCQQWSKPFGSFKGENLTLERLSDINKKHNDGWDMKYIVGDGSERNKLPLKQVLKLLQNPKYSLESLFDRVIPIKETGGYIVGYNNMFNIVTKDRELVKKDLYEKWFSSIQSYGYKAYYIVSKSFKGRKKVNLLDMASYNYIFGNDKDLGNWFNDISKPKQGNLAVVYCDVVVLGNERNENGALQPMFDENGNMMMANRKNVINLDTGKILIDDSRYGWFDGIDNMYNDYAIVAKTDNKKNDKNFKPVFNYVSKTGEMLFRNQNQNTWPDQVTRFSPQGFAMVGKNGNYRLVNKEGNLIPNFWVYTINGQPDRSEHSNSLNVLPMFEDFDGEWLIPISVNVEDFEKHNLMRPDGTLILDQNDINIWSDEPVNYFCGYFIVTAFDEEGNPWYNLMDENGGFAFSQDDIEAWAVDIVPGGEGAIVTFNDGSEKIIPNNRRKNLKESVVKNCVGQILRNYFKQ